MGLGVNHAASIVPPSPPRQRFMFANVWPGWGAAAGGGYNVRMNLLSHALLSPAEPGQLVGNLIADWVKGRARHALPADFRTGMELHRRIDAFTDTHAIVERCSALLAPRWGRYAPVLVDIFFDHCLSVQWAQHSATRRQTFIAGVYETLRVHRALLPERAHYAVGALLADDWFNKYATLDGIGLVLTRLAARLRHGIELAPAVDDFRVHQHAFDEGFAAFFPLVRAHVQAGATPAPQ